LTYKINKVLIIGFGSIGFKHFSCLKKIDKSLKIKFLSSKDVINKSVIKKINPDYIIISTPTHLHYKYLKLVDLQLKKKIILVEKPIFHKNLNFKKNQKNLNRIFVGYNFRFNPIIFYLKKFLSNKKIYYINSSCFSYLPNWRKKNYSKTYSSYRNLGGGVSLDLSHEIDYVSWLFGKIKINYLKKYKCSNLKIKSDDLFILDGKINNIRVNITLSYSSRINQRSILIDGNQFSLKADLIRGEIYFLTNGKKKILKFKNYNQSDMLINMHKSIISNKFDNFSKTKDAINIIKILND